MSMVSGLLTGPLLIVTTIAFGALLIVLYPLLNKESRGFAVFSVAMGIIVWLLLLWFTFGNAEIRHQILVYGLH